MDSQKLFYHPFNYKINPMEKLLLIGFEKDPDTIYIGFEPQQFAEGLRVIAWRRDGYVDVYQSESLPLEKNFDVAGKGLADILQRPMAGARFNVTPTGVDVFFSFEDKTGRYIEVEIVEQGRRSTHPFTILAPVGSSSEKPSSLPLYYLFDFYFVRKANTHVNISIDRVKHKPDSFPALMDGSRIYYMRYSADTFLVDWCVSADGELMPLSLAGEKTVHQNGITYHFADDSGCWSLQSMSGKLRGHQVMVQFNPHYPDVTGLPVDAAVDGTFVITTDDSAGTLSGTYRVRKQGDNHEVELQPTVGWRPRPSTFFTRFLFAVAKIFKQWPTTYVYKAVFSLRGDGATISSKWHRV